MRSADNTLLFTSPTPTPMATPTKSAAQTSDSTDLVPGASVLMGEDGETVVHNQVVAKIAGLTVQEIEGVHRLVPFGPGQTVSSFAKTITRSSMHELGVNVEVGQKKPPSTCASSRPTARRFPKSPKASAATSRTESSR